MIIGAPLLRAVNVLRHIVDQEVPPTISELSRALALPKPTTYRLAAALEKAGLVRKDPLTRRYQVGDAMEALAFGAIRTGVGHSVRRFHMQALSDEVGERVNLGVLSADKEPHVAWVDSVSPRGDGAKLDVNPGLRLPLHCTANGKLLLAHAQSVFRRRILDSAPYRAHTKNSITTASVLLAEIERIQERGFSEDREEFLDGVVCLAVPVRDGREQVVAGLAIMAPVARLSLENVRGRLPDLRACADSISRELARPKTAGSGRGNGTGR
jgi:DNA-binding IclR family transcriptional regulator